MEIVYIVIGIVAGGLGGWTFAQTKFSSRIQDFIGRLSSATASLQSANQNLADRADEIEKLKKNIEEHRLQINDSTQKLRQNGLQKML